MFSQNSVVIVVLHINSFILCELILPIHLGRDDELYTTEPHEEIRLDDFFWTGSGDGPPEYLKKVHTGIGKGKDVIVKTETVIATVYVENENDPNSMCFDCIQNSKGNNLNYTVVDRRYWLLTVLSGYFHPPEYPILKDKLAKLYRIAFTRQQSRHLGIINHVSENITEINRKRRQVTKQVKENRNNARISILTPEEFDESPEVLEDEKNKIVSSILLPYSSSFEDNSEMDEIQNTKNNDVHESVKNSNQKNDFYERQVKVVIHNATMIKEDDIQSWMENRYEDMYDRRNELPFANQTEFIYTVFVDGKPVLATAAADDMKLITDDEVTKILDRIVFMKAEPYLKEPQATALVPATNNSTSSFFTTIAHNSVLIAVSSIIILLLLLLIIVLLLMMKARYRRNEEIKRFSSHQRLLLMEHQRSQDQFPEVSSKTIHEKGTQNQGYEQEYSPQDKNEHGKKLQATIDFPTPPKGVRPSSSETTITSDSSVYCPVNRPKIDLQAMLDEKASKLFEKKHRSSHTHAESKVNTGIHKKRDKKMKYKHKKRYLSENRVGSIEEVQNQFSDTSMSSDSLSETSKTNYERLQRNEAYNPNNNYNRNKILQNRVFTDKVIYDTVNEDNFTPKEAVNREMVKKIKFGDKSSESGGSIGSFLSMASVRSFPKTVLPEPLHRVLEPVTVTHYDEYENSVPRIPKIRSRENTTRSGRNDSLGSVMKKSHSESQDPGVLGPVVWEIHKKTSRESKPIDGSIYEPAASRIRFEGLLESAIQLYSNSENTSLPTTVNVQNTLSRPKENRGKSAIITGNSSNIPKKSNSNIIDRPLTADPISSISDYAQTQPPTPNEKAWQSRVSSPQIRPLSAGPFHRPQTPIVDVARMLGSQSVDKNNLSAAPLIEAIQNELKKFKTNNHQ